MAKWIENPAALRPGDSHATGFSWRGRCRRHRPWPRIWGRCGNRPGGRRARGRGVRQRPSLKNCIVAPVMSRPGNRRPPGLISQKQVKAKFTPASLRAFLQKPEEHYAWIRMPNFSSFGRGAGNLAAYLESVADPAEASKPASDDALIAKGKALVADSGCLQLPHVGGRQVPLAAKPCRNWARIAGAPVASLPPPRMDQGAPLFLHGRGSGCAEGVRRHRSRRWRSPRMRNFSNASPTISIAANATGSSMASPVGSCCMESSSRSGQRVSFRAGRPGSRVRGWTPACRPFRLMPADSRGGLPPWRDIPGVTGGSGPCRRGDFGDRWTEAGVRQRGLQLHQLPWSWGLRCDAGLRSAGNQSPTVPNVCSRTTSVAGCGHPPAWMRNPRCRCISTRRDAARCRTSLEGRSETIAAIWEYLRLGSKAPKPE